MQILYVRSWLAEKKFDLTDLWSNANFYAMGPDLFIMADNDKYSKKCINSE